MFEPTYVGCYKLNTLPQEVQRLQRTHAGFAAEVATLVRIEFGIARNVFPYYSTGMSTISLKLPDKLLNLLEKESRARRTTKSSLIRESLEKTLASRPGGDKASCYDLAQDLAGSVKGLPRDLATNSKHMEGFGR